jgi:hypothetical protein
MNKQYIQANLWRLLQLAVKYVLCDHSQLMLAFSERIAHNLGAAWRRFFKIADRVQARGPGFEGCTVRRAALLQACRLVSHQIMGRVEASHSSAMLGIHRRCPCPTCSRAMPSRGRIYRQAAIRVCMRVIAATRALRLER